MKESAVAENQPGAERLLQNRMTSNTDISNWVDRLRDFMARSLSSDSSRPRAADAADDDEPFNSLALELWAWQRRRNPVLARWAATRAADSISHWTEIPALPAAAFKEGEVSCIPPPERSAVFHSSGTTGARPGRHFHHRASLAVYEDSLWSWFQRHWAPDDRWPRAVFLTPPPAQAPHSSLVHMLETIRRRARCDHTLYAGHADPETAGWDLSAPRVEALLSLAENTGEPVGLIGTAFNFVQLLDDLEARDLRVVLPPGSRVMETGGYKGRTRTIPQDRLHAWMGERLGIPRNCIMREYGMSELSSQAYDRTVPNRPVATRDVPAGDSESTVRAQDPRETREATGCFQFPPWTRTRIVSPEHGREVALGETGLIQVYDLANVWSALALQTEDLGARRPCGFELVGRIPRAEPKGCSLQALP